MRGEEKERGTGVEEESRRGGEEKIIKGEERRYEERIKGG